MSAQIFEQANQLQQAINNYAITTLDELEQFRIKFIGTKGEVKTLMGQMKEIAAEQRREFGQLVNEVKNNAETKWQQHKELLEQQANFTTKAPDLTLPVNRPNEGSRHPIALFMDKVIQIFNRMGFVVADGPEIEDDWHNFTAINTPEDHPSRDMQDTFYIDVETQPNILLRTHTSPIQARVMLSQKPPIRIIAPGRVYRNETISARSHCQFHQLEGLYIAENVSFADMKYTLTHFVYDMFGSNTKIRLRPSFFPFTEPSAEMDISCFICDAKGCPVCKYTGWVEILGCGMVDPQVLQNCKIDPEVYSGFAWGMGIERTCMQYYGINDIRLMFENDVRFLQQFA